MKFTLKIWRQENAKAKGHFETYKIDGISPDTSFLEMMDILNEQLVAEKMNPVAFDKGCKDHSGPVSFDHDCREGICGACSLYINGRAHGPESGVTTRQEVLFQSIPEVFRMPTQYLLKKRTQRKVWMLPPA